MSRAPASKGAGAVDGVAPVVGAAVAIAAVVIVFAGGCGIAPTDPLPGIGAVCAVADGHCDVEHVCVPDSVGAAKGKCAPLASFGACDAATPVTHPPGRKGKDEDKPEIEIGGTEDLAFIQDVRSTTGQVRTFKQGPDNVDIPDLCDFRDLQRTGDGLGIGDTENVTSLDGLQSVTSVQKGLAIVDNTALTDISALANLVDLTPRESENTSFDVIIAGNPQLDDADVDAFVADLKGRLGRDIQVVACNNHGVPCGVTERALLDALVAQGFH